MFVWHHLVASQIYSWPLVTGTDLPPCWSLKEPIPNDLGKRQPLALTRGRWWRRIYTGSAWHLHLQEFSIILFKSIIDGRFIQAGQRNALCEWFWGQTMKLRVFLLLATLCRRFLGQNMKLRVVLLPETLDIPQYWPRTIANIETILSPLVQELRRFC